MLATSRTMSERVIPCPLMTLPSPRSHAASTIRPISASISLQVPSRQMTVFCMADRSSVARARYEIYARVLRIEETPTMTKPLDPVIAQIIPLLPLRDPKIMTPQSARDALRALAASRAAVPPPPVASTEDIEVKRAAGPLAARVYRVSAATSPTVVFFHGGGWVAGDLETHDRQARWLAIETGA